WGKADPDETVTLTVIQEKNPGRVEIESKATADSSGKWSFRLPKIAPGTGLVITLKGKNTVTLKNVAVGEVWVCSGQSNMEWSVNASANAEQAIAAADNRDLRLFTVPKVAATEQQTTVRGRWQVCSPQTVRGFSPVAYFFGRD